MDEYAQPGRDLTYADDVQARQTAPTRSPIAILAEMNAAELADAQLSQWRYREIIKDRAKQEQAAFDPIARAGRQRS